MLATGSTANARNHCKKGGQPIDAESASVTILTERDEPMTELCRHRELIVGRLHRQDDRREGDVGLGGSLMALWNAVTVTLQLRNPGMETQSSIRLHQYF